jgi:hypothetical protein
LAGKLGDVGRLEPVGVDAVHGEVEIVAALVLPHPEFSRCSI